MYPEARAVAVALAAALVGCGADDAPARPHAPPVETEGCHPGEVTLESGACRPAGLPTDMPCAPGEWADADGACQPAGTPAGACGPGFEADGTGACKAVLPEAACSAGTMAVPGEAQCRPVAPCPAGKWPEVSASDAVQYVDVSYTGADADGDVSRPWPTIQQGIDAAASGGVVAIAAGAYGGALQIKGKPVRLWGVCAGKVEISADSGTIVAVGKSAAGTHLRDVAITGDGGALVVSGSKDVLLERVWIHDVPGGRGVSVEDLFGPTAVTLRGSLIEDVLGIGVAVIGAEATVESSVIRGTLPQLPTGAGIATNNSPSGARSRLTVTGSVIAANEGIGVYVLGGDATVESTEIEGGAGWGIGARNDGEARANLTVRACVIEDDHEVGLSVLGSDAVVEATSVRSTLPKSNGEAGVGVRISSESGQPAHAEISSSVVEKNHAVGLLVYGADVLLEGTALRDTDPDGDGLLGRGVEVQGNAKSGAPSTVTVRGSAIQRNHDRGVSISGSDVTLDATLIEGTLPAAAERTGWGVGAWPDPTSARRSLLTVTSSVVAGNQDVGIAVVGSDASIDGSVVKDTQLESHGWYGRGLVLQDAAATVRASVFEGNHEMGVLVLGPGATLDGVVVRGTLQDADGRFGDGIAILASSLSTSENVPTTATITGALVDGSARAAMSNFGAVVTFGSSAFSCSAFALEGEQYSGASFEYIHLGGNECGCPADEECQVLSAGLEPPVELPSNPDPAH